MAEAHNCLCLGKAFSTDLLMKDIEICRLACGGHGFHHYSGIPSLLQEVSPVTTLEGENTVMYLQLSRYLLKSYKNSITKKHELSHSVKYLADFDQIMKSRVAVPSGDQWALSNISLLLKQCVCFLLATSNEIIRKNESGNSIDTKNKHAALRLVQMSMMHSLLYYFDGFHQTIAKFNGCPDAKKLLEQICLLFGANALLGKALVLAESGLIVPEVLGSLERCRERLLKELRPMTATIIDGIGMPDSAIRSLIVSGNIYEVKLF